MTVQIRGATRRSTLTGPAGSFNDHGEIISINETNIVKVLPASTESELSESSRRGSSSAIALDLTGTAVAGYAGSRTGSVEVTGSSAPETTGPTSRSEKGAGSVLGEFETGGAESRIAGIGENPRPNGEIAPVNEGECGGSANGE